MPDELWNTLIRFHREVAAPDIVGPLRDEITSSRRETAGGFDAVYTRFDHLESEYQALRAAVERLEGRMTAVDQTVDRMALRSELLELKAQVAGLEERIAQLQSEI